MSVAVVGARLLLLLRWAEGRADDDGDDDGDDDDDDDDDDDNDGDGDEVDSGGDGNSNLFSCWRSWWCFSVRGFIHSCVKACSVALVSFKRSLP